MSEYSPVAIETLSRTKDQLVARLGQLTPPVALEENEVGDALGWSLLFEHWPELVPGLTLDRENAFYNRYFWFKRFATLKQKRDGYDAGLDQQVFQALEHADFEVDWALVEQIDARAADVPS
jgi:hypothetical protein